MKPYLRYTFGLILKHRRKAMTALFLMVVSTALRLVQPFLYRGIVDTLSHGLSAGFNEGDKLFLIENVGLWFLLALSGNMVGPWMNYIGYGLANLAIGHVNEEGYLSVLRMDWQKHTGSHSSEFVKLLENSRDGIWKVVEWWLNRFLPAGMGFLAMLVIAFSVNWQMTLASLAVIPVGLLVVVKMMNRYEGEQLKVNKLWQAIDDHASDQITNIVTYKINQEEKRFHREHVAVFEKATASQMALNKKWRLVTMLNPDIIAHFLVMGMGVILVRDGKITLGTLFMFMGLLNEILVPLRVMGDILPDYSRRARHIEKFLRFAARENKVTDPEKPLPLKKVEGKIEFRNVSFHYETKTKKERAISNFSFTVEPGRHVAIVGHTGAGKSTIMALVTRLVDPTNGAVLLDGTDIRQFRQEGYRKFIGTVLQENSLYSESVARNIAYSKPRATRPEIIAAAKQAQAHDFIMKLKKGYDTNIGERGVRLSGGEKQRLAIARAILKNPRIVVLDEPTSALDSITEARVQEALDKLVEGRTSIVIAHRLATVRHAGLILVMQHGRLLCSGSHEQLQKNCAVYRRMVELQTGGFLADE